MEGDTPVSQPLEQMAAPPAPERQPPVNPGTGAVDQFGFVPPEGVKLQQPQPMDTAGMTGDEQFLYGPDQGAAPLGPPRAKAPIPERVWKAMPALVQAAKDPDAPPAVLALVRLLNNRING